MVYILAERKKNVLDNNFKYRLINININAGKMCLLL